MSLTDALARIQQIQTQIAEVTSTPLPAASSTGNSGAAAATNASSFASQLSSASATTPATASTAGLVQNGTTGANVLADAQKYLGVPYVFGGTTTAGMDCSGLVQTVFKDLGISMPRTVGPQSTMGQAVPSLADAQPGDLIVEKGNGHIQIYAGNGMILEAPRAGENVVERKEWLSADQIGTIRRIVPATAASATTGTSATAGTTAAPNSAALQSILAQQLSASSGTASTSSLSSLIGSSS